MDVSTLLPVQRSGRNQMHELRDKSGGGMTRETYKGRNLRAKKGTGLEYGQIHGYVNDHLVSSHGRSESEVIEQLRRDIDAVDIDERVGAYGAYWYAA